MAGAVYHALSELPRQPHVLTIGNFDGVHRGHQFLFERVRERAAARRATSLVVTFDPLPAEVLRPEAAPPRLCTLDQRLALIQACQVDRVVVLRFDEPFARQDPSAFVERVARDALPLEFVIGDDFRFGRDRAGTVDTLRELGDRFGYEVTVVPRVDFDSQPISSTEIRRLVREGAVDLAARLLARPYALTGSVIEGHRRGQLLGYPTANLRLIDRLAVPADGIYAVFAVAEGMPSPLPGMAYIGTRPVFRDGERAIEVHLFDTSIDLYGRRMTVLFVRWLRDDRWFPSIDELIEQMRADEREARAALSGDIELWSSPLTRAVLAVVAEGAVSPDG